MDGYKVVKFASEESFIAYCFNRPMPPAPPDIIEIKAVHKHGSKNMRPGERRCTLCKQWKPATRAYFYKNLVVSDGCQSKCRLCESRRGRLENGDYSDRIVYFLQITSDGKGLDREGWIKIGRTKDLYERVRAFRYQEKCEADILGIIKGRFDDELELKGWFHQYKVSGHEWLRPAPELLDWIKRYSKPTLLLAGYKPKKSYYKEGLAKAA